MNQKSSNTKREDRRTFYVESQIDARLDDFRSRIKRRSGVSLRRSAIVRAFFKALDGADESLENVQDQEELAAKFAVLLGAKSAKRK